MIPVYINHYLPLTERKNYLDMALINLENKIWVIEPDKDQITDEMLDKWYDPSPKEWARKCKKYYKEIPPWRLMKKSDISCSLGHILAWEDFVKTGSGRFALFLEDDVIFKIGFETELQNIVNNAPQDADVVFIGGGFDHTIAKTIRQNGEYFLKEHPATNCLCSYMLTREASKRLVEIVQKFTLPIDFEANYWFDQLGFNVYHKIPYIAQEGTAMGVYQSVQTR